MTEPNASAGVTSLLDNIILDAFFSLSETKDLSHLLREALQFISAIFQAEASSILFVSTSTEQIKVGQAPSPVWSYIERQEQAVIDRLHSGLWRILEVENMPVSRRSFSDAELILLNTPLLKQNQVIGSISLVLAKETLFTPSHQHTLTRLARGIGQMASSSADLIIAKQQYKELDMLYQVGQALMSTVDINELLENVMRLSANVLNAAAASIMLIDEARQELAFEFTHSPRQQQLKKQRINLSEGIAGWVASNGRPVIANEVHKDPRFNKKIDTRTGFLTISIAAVPLKLKGNVVGVLEVLNKYSESGFDDNDLRLMTSIAAQTAIALENAKLYQYLMEEREKIIKAQEDVRKELSRNLHDGAVQQMSAISMNIEYVQKLLEVDQKAASKELVGIQEMANKAAKQARLVLFELRPIILETEGLISALDRYVAQLNETESFIVEADLSPIPVKLGKTVEGTIFSIIQEAVNNIKRHAEATQVEVCVAAKPTLLEIYVKDNGIGFDVVATQTGYAGRNSLGLLNMQERAKLIEGKLTINSNINAPDTGTTIMLLVPLKRGTGLLNQSLLLGENNG